MTKKISLHILITLSFTVLATELAFSKEECAIELSYSQEDIEAAIEMAYDVGVTEVVTSLDIHYISLLSWMYKYETELMTQQEQRHLSETYKDGAVQLAIHQKSINKAAKQLGIPYQNLYNWFRKRYGSARDMFRNGLLIDNRENSKYTEEFKAEAVELAHEKQSVRKAAEELRIPYSTLNKWYRSVYGISQERPRYTEEFKFEAVQLAHQIGSIREAAKQLNIPQKTLNSWYRSIHEYHRGYSEYDEKFRAVYLAHQKESKRLAKKLVNILYRALRKQIVEAEKEFKARAVRLAHEKGVREAAEELNISYWNLNRWYRKTYGRSQRHPKYTEKFKIEAVQLARQIGSIQEAAKQLNIPEDSLRRWNREINHESFQDNSREAVNF